VQAGCRVQQLADALAPYGLTLQNYASIRDQQIGGFTQVRSALTWVLLLCRVDLSPPATGCRRVASRGKLVIGGWIVGGRLHVSYCQHCVPGHEAWYSCRACLVQCTTHRQCLRHLCALAAFVPLLLLSAVHFLSLHLGPYRGFTNEQKQPRLFKHTTALFP
jgi:hypothetical protein